MNTVKIAVLGAGAAGLSAAYTLRKSGKEATVFEKDKNFGGLCSSFTIDGFTFDTFAHLTFSKDPYVNSLLEDKTDYLIHKPEALNYYKGVWIKNPAQNNLFPLPTNEKVKIIKDFIARREKPCQNYEDWLRNQYGDYFTDNFPARYTRKYWTVEPCELEPKWVEGRMYRPSIEEVLYGAMSENTPCVHYSKEMHYPKHGGFQAFLAPLAEKTDIRYGKQLCKIDSAHKILTFTDGEETAYQKLISTIPLTELIPMVENVPGKVKNAAKGLDYTSGIMISLGFNRENVSPALWFYIYDEDIFPARVYSPSIKSPENVPQGCSSIQAEIYYSSKKPLIDTPKNIAEKAIRQLLRLNLFQENEIVLKDIRARKYANIMFTPQIYRNRKIIHDYLDELGIFYAGRFGEWDYLWVGQSMISGKRTAEKVIMNQA